MDGVLIIDKPAGLTSHDVVDQVRRILRERRVGHTGTLDPFATGVLVILVGRATRLAQFLSGVEKEYEAVIRLGYGTDTGDATGKPISDPDVNSTTNQWTREQIETALASLRGEIDQVPPMYSAKKQAGRKLYELARQGKEVERKAVRVCIHKFEALNSSGDVLQDNLDGTFDFKVRVACSTGTYVRTLAEDFGKQLKVGAHLAELRRTRVGDMLIADAKTPEQLQVAVAEDSLAKILYKPDEALTRLPFVDLAGDELRRVMHGLDVKVTGAARSLWSQGERVRVRDEAGNLVAVAVFNRAEGALHPSVVIPENL